MQHTFAAPSVAARLSPSARGHSLGAERAPRMVRGYDAAGNVLFRAPASKAGHPSARKGMDANLVRTKFAALGTKLVRVEVDVRSGDPETYVVNETGDMRGCAMVDGRVVMVF